MQINIPSKSIFIHRVKPSRQQWWPAVTGPAPDRPPDRARQAPLESTVRKRETRPRTTKASWGLPVGKKWEKKKCIHTNKDYKAIKLLEKCSQQTSAHCRLDSETLHLLRGTGRHGDAAEPQRQLAHTQAWDRRAVFGTEDDFRFFLIFGIFFS